MNWVAHDAVISPCGRYRPWLMRHEDQFGASGVCVFIMLNPSTADAAKDDPTIRRCRAFTRRLDCSTLVVVNLFSARATDPGELTRFDDPVGPQCDDAIETALRLVRHDCRSVADDAFGGSRRIGKDDPDHSIAVAAWGAAPSTALSWFQPRRHNRVLGIVELAGRLDVPLKAFGLTIDGSPRHPLYVRADAPLVSFREGRRAA